MKGLPLNLDCPHSEANQECTVYITSHRLKDPVKLECDNHGDITAEIILIRERIQNLIDTNEQV